MKMNVGTKIYAGFALVIAIFIIIGVTSYISLTEIVTKEDLGDQTSEVQLQIADLLSDMQNAETGERGYIITGDVNFLEPYNAALKEINICIKNLRELTKDNPNQQKRLDTLEPLITTQLAYYTEIIDLRKNQGFNTTQEVIASGTGKKEMDAIRKVLDEMGAEELNLFTLRKGESDSASQNAKNVIIFGTLIAVITGAAVGFILTRDISKPLGDLTFAADKISKGDINVKIGYEKRQDELGILAKSFTSMSEYIIGIVKAAERIAAQDLTQAIKAQSDKDTLGIAFAKMQENLRINIEAKDEAAAQTLKATEKLNEQVRGIKEAVVALTSSAAEIAASTKEFAASSAQITSSVSETTSTAEEVKQTATLANEKAESISKESAENANLAKKGSESVRQAVEGINSIKAQTALVAESIIKLSEQSQAIGDIISSVNDLAEQSNLLAVNAAIEAAKAGEQGKGFTVVAQEVKTLADQSKQATAQVRTILNDIQKATSNAVMSTEKVTKAVEVGVKQFSESGDVIDKIAARSAVAADASVQILSSSQQQLVGMKQITQAMESIKQASEQTLAGAKQLEKAAEEVNRMGQKLNELTK